MVPDSSAFTMLLTRWPVLRTVTEEPPSEKDPDRWISLNALTAGPQAGLLQAVTHLFLHFRLVQLHIPQRVAERLDLIAQGVWGKHFRQPPQLSSPRGILIEQAEAGRGLPERGGRGLFLAGAVEGKLDRVTLLAALNEFPQLGRVHEQLALQIGEHVVPLQAGFGSRAVGGNIGHDQSRTGCKAELRSKGF